MFRESRGGKLIDWSPTAGGIIVVPFTTFTGELPLMSRLKSFLRNLDESSEVTFRSLLLAFSAKKIVS